MSLNNEGMMTMSNPRSFLLSFFAVMDKLFCRACASVCVRNIVLRIIKVHRTFSDSSQIRDIFMKISHSKNL